VAAPVLAASRGHQLDELGALQTRDRPELEQVVREHHPGQLRRDDAGPALRVGVGVGAEQLGQRLGQLAFEHLAQQAGDHCFPADRADHRTQRSAPGRVVPGRLATP
jgi:hypothetical protein